MLRIFAWIELFVSIVFLTLVVWPFSGFRSGRPVGFDCESWSIFGMNFFGPMGLLPFVCSIRSLKKKTLVPQYFLVCGGAMSTVYWFSQVY
jgi:hypothetical protein